ncbi:MAG: hypothetical protein EOP57_01385 [Sphingomonadales bacterium]|nr:MAG: hypothetical protein EOP57_01385 [Sphingomonadales bacterium]
MKFLLAVLALAVSAVPAQAQEADFQGRQNGFEISFTEIARNGDDSWKSAEVLVTGPQGYIQYFTATFKGTDHGMIEVEGDPCTISIETFADAHGYDAGWKVSMKPGDDEKVGCDGFPRGLPGTYEAF